MEIPTVLLVDDEMEVLKVISLSLQGKGFKVRTASNGADALHFMQTDMPDIVIMDIFMPAMDGYQVQQKMRSDCKTVDVPIIMLSAALSPEERSKALDLGADDYISKPHEPKEFISRINALLRREQGQRGAKRINKI
jgi:DNA-binding response OmpR family regulator